MSPDRYRPGTVVPNTIQLETVIINNLQEDNYEGVPKIITYQSLAKMCGLNPEKYCVKSRLCKLIHTVFSGILTPIFENGEFTNSWSYLPNELCLVTEEHNTSIKSDFGRNNTDNRKHYHNGRNKVPKGFNVILRQKTDNEGNTYYERI